MNLSLLKPSFAPLAAAATLLTAQLTVGQAVATYFNRNIASECDTRIQSFAAAGHKILCVAFPPAGGNSWSIVTDKTFYNRNVPTELHTQMLAYYNAGHKILCVAFPPAGGNSWSIITDRSYFNRNVPTECHTYMGTLTKAGHKLRWVAYPPAGGNTWSILTDRGFANRGVPSELHSQMLAFSNAGHVNTCVAFPPAGGNTWTVMTDKGSFFNRGVTGECHRVMRAMIRVPGDPLQTVAFDPDGNGFSVISSADPDGKAAVITYGAEVFDLDDFADKLAASLNGKGVKYGFVVRHGAAIRSRSAGAKRTAYTPPAQPFTIYDRFNPASVTKTVTGVALLRALQEKNISVNEYIYKYLPSFWTIPSSVRTITFAQLLGHTSGFRAGDPAFAYDYNGMRAMVAAGIDPANKVYDYENVNYALARIVCCYVQGYSESGVSDHGAKTSSQFIAWVQAKLMDPCGAPSVLWKPDSVEPTLFFPNPAGSSTGTTYGDWSLRPGSAGVNISLAELGIFLDVLANSSSILNSTYRALMDSSNLGWDSRKSIKNGTLNVKGGYFPASYNGGAELHSYVYKFSSGVQLSCVINGLVGVGGEIETAYTNSWGPQTVALSSATSSIANVTAGSVLVTGTNLHLTKTAYFGSTAITSQNATDPTLPYFRIISSRQIQIHPPQGLVPANYAVKVYSGAMTSNSLSVAVVKPSTPTLLVTPQPVAGLNYDAVLARGNVAAAQAWLAISNSSNPSVLPGIFNFDIGDNFNLLFFWPLAGAFPTNTDTAHFDLPSLASLKGETFYFQALYATRGYPLPVSNVATIKFQ
ncbi:MAG: serine hydrolase [Planctomycetes bacterium]|nr:serine hydrolase [Planctomycetota bacterium]MCB9868788.1 serine hydrolase [Planctomycetota bacterium]